MLRKQIVHRALALFLMTAVFCVYSKVGFAAGGGPNPLTAGITITGQVSVNGSPQVSDSTVFSGSTVITAPNASAVIDLGENGRIEILEKSSLTLNFTENDITGVLSTGSIRVSSGAGKEAVFKTGSSVITSDRSQANAFSIQVDCADTSKCGDTFVETIEGLVTLKNGPTEKQISAGMNSADLDPANAAARRAHNKRTAFWLILSAAAAVGLAIYFIKRDDNVVSPIR